MATTPVSTAASSGETTSRVVSLAVRPGPREAPSIDRLTLPFGHPDLLVESYFGWKLDPSKDWPALSTDGRPCRLWGYLGGRSPA
jgi:hypothetical protein